MSNIPDTSIAHNANGHACSQAGQPTGESGSQVCIAVEQVVRLVSGLVDCRSTASVRLHVLPSAQHDMHICSTRTFLCLLQISLNSMHLAPGMLQPTNMQYTSFGHHSAGTLVFSSEAGKHCREGGGGSLPVEMMTAMMSP